MKHIVYRDLSDKVQELQDRITQAVCNIDEHTSK